MEVGEQFSLCWNNFHSNLSSGFNNLLQNEQLVDVTLAAEGRILKAHKSILSICSPFFRDLFLATPCDHPIVILPDVDFGALKHLLHFMYNGEVSVSQEEIKTFMKVAEMLKVKGLTESETSNGVSGNVDDNDNDDNQPQKTRRIRPAKKLICPQQPLRLVGNPVATKRPYEAISDDHENFLGAVQNEALPLVKLKTEPEDVKPNSTIDDCGTTLDSLLSGGDEPSPSISSDVTPQNSGDEISQPGTLQLILGRRGNPRLVIDGYSFYKKSVYKGKVFWYCKNRLRNKCPATTYTLRGDIVKRPCAHTHPVRSDQFNPDEDSEVPIDNLEKVLWQISHN